MMRQLIFASALVLGACATPAPVTSRALVAADAATALAVGERITEERSTQPARDGMDPLVTLALRHADGRRLVFQQSNHTEHDLLAQRPGGPLAQIMGLDGEAAPVLYRASGEDDAGAFFCGPDGPALIGVFEAPDGLIVVTGLEQEIQFETRPDGETEAVPFSPDQVCARLRFRQG